MSLSMSASPATAPDELPLLEWLAASPARTASTCGVPSMARMPDRVPAAGEQYRFHFDMGTCIGCKCCVVACNEQHGNPASINWRRVGEIQGGWYPHATQSYLSMGCNHCLEPTCLAGCPVDAYTKDPQTGLVRHSADACIGCQYCTWNCSYGVPQYNPERGVVGKCDMCHGRLTTGQSPACVSACPEGAIAIEIVAVADWRASVASVLPPSGTPVGDGSLSTTRITLPEALPPDARPQDLTHVAPEHPHWPLVVMTVLTQLSVGVFTTIWLLQLFDRGTRLGLTALASLGVASLALGASTLHLGRPIHAYRALRMWRRSWLSREVLLFSGFSGVAAVYATMLWFGIPGSAWVGALTMVLGAAGITASACIYLVPSRPAWNSWHTIADFLLTAGVLGPTFAAAIGAGDAHLLALAASSLACAHFALIALRFLACIASDSLELRGTARLLSTQLAGVLLWRGGLLAVGAVVLPLAAEGVAVAAASLALTLTAQLLGRYLFFVSVVPKHLAAAYLATAREAA
jgi:Fe-S-cluster-containing dehydrogenase component/DMSO reductase anchor subunit